MRWLGSFLVAVAIVLASFVLMLILIFPPHSTEQEPALQMGYFVPKQQTESKEPSRSRRQLPETPVEPELHTPPAQQPPQPISPPATASLELTVPQLPSTINLAAASTPSLQGLTAHTPTPVPDPTPAAPPTAPAAPVVAAPAAPAQPTASASGPQNAANDDAEVIPLNNVLPVYPDSARRRGIEGYVELAFTITATGRVENVRILESSPNRVFDREARRAALRWRFAPRREGGQLVAREAVKRLEFRLEKEGR